MAKRQTIIKTSLGIVAILVVSFIAMGVLTDMKEPPKKFDKEQQHRAVIVEEVKYDTIKATVTATGRIVSSEIVELISEVPGKLLPADGRMCLYRATSRAKRRSGSLPTI